MSNYLPKEESRKSIRSIPAEISFNRDSWGLVVNGKLIDTKDVVKNREESTGTKHVFTLTVRVPLSELIPGADEERLPEGSKFSIPEQSKDGR